MRPFNAWVNRTETYLTISSLIYVLPTYDPNYINGFRYLAFDYSKCNNIKTSSSVINTASFPVSKIVGSSINSGYLFLNCFITDIYCYEFNASPFYISTSLSSSTSTSIIVDFDTSARLTSCGSVVRQFYLCVAVYSHPSVIIRYGELVVNTTDSPTLSFQANDPTNLFFIGLIGWKQPAPSSAPYCFGLHLNSDSVSFNTDISIFTEVKYKYFQIY